MKEKNERLIMIVDDEPDIVELVSVNLKKNGFDVKGFEDGDAFFKGLKKRIPELVILDLMLPGTDGFEICKQLKNDPQYSSVPVIMLTAKSDETDKVLGLELGADDYITKPFSPKELVARVKAVLRRNIQKISGKQLEAGAVMMDLERHTVTVKGEKIELTGTEFNILKLLMSRKGSVFSRDSILDSLWGEEKIVVDRTIDVHIKHLREKLKSAGDMIINVRGIGYKLEIEG